MKIKMNQIGLKLTEKNLEMQLIASKVLRAPNEKKFRSLLQAGNYFDDGFTGKLLRYLG